MKNIFDGPIYPWELLLLLKWGLVKCAQNTSGDKIERLKLERIYAEEFNRILELGVEIIRLGPIFPNDVPHSDLKMLRLFCYQQFWCQRTCTFDSIVRPAILMSSDISEDRIEQLFERQAGIALSTFFDLSFLLSMRTDMPRRIQAEAVTEKYFKNVTDFYSKEEIFQYLSLVSDNEDGIYSLAVDSFKINPVHLQLAEQTPFVEAPLVRYDANTLSFMNKETLYFVISPMLIEELVRDFPIIKIKKELGDNKQIFTQMLGNRFEKYIELGLDHLSVPYCKEEHLQNVLRYSKKKNFKPVDFIFELDGRNVLLEAKSNLPHGEAKINMHSSVLTKRFNDDLIRSFKKLYSTADRLSKSSNVKELYDGFNSHSELFGIVVTYDELFLWDGFRAWEEFIGDEVSMYLKEEGISPDVINLNNVLIMSVSSFDKLVELFARKRISMSQLIQKVRKQRKRFHKKITNSVVLSNEEKVVTSFHGMSFEHYLDDFEPDLKNLPYIFDKWTQFHTTLEKAFARGSKA